SKLATIKSEAFCLFWLPVRWCMLPHTILPQRHAIPRANLQLYDSARCLNATLPHDTPSRGRTLQAARSVCTLFCEPEGSAPLLWAFASILCKPEGPVRLFA